MRPVSDTQKDNKKCHVTDTKTKRVFKINVTYQTQDCRSGEIACPASGTRKNYNSTSLLTQKRHTCKAYAAYQTQDDPAGRTVYPVSDAQKGDSVAAILTPEERLPVKQMSRIRHKAVHVRKIMGPGTTHCNRHRNK